MRAYGVKRKDRGCCPGHDKYPPDRYNTTGSKQRKRAQKSRKTRARMWAKEFISKLMKHLDSKTD